MTKAFGIAAIALAMGLGLTAAVALGGGLPSQANPPTYVRTRIGPKLKERIFFIDSATLCDTIRTKTKTRRHQPPMAVPYGAAALAERRG